MRFYTFKVTLRAQSDQFLLTPHLLGEILWGAHDSSLSHALLECQGWDFHELYIAGSCMVNKQYLKLQICYRAHEEAERTIATSQS
jgi:hypothetical protein